MTKKNRLVKTTLLLLKDGKLREIQEYSVGWDFVKTTNNGNPTWVPSGYYDINDDYYKGSTVLEREKRFREPLSGIYFDSLEEAIDFYEVHMRDTVVEHLTIDH